MTTTTSHPPFSDDAAATNASAATTIDVSTITFRVCRPTDIAACAVLETASYPPNEAASQSGLEYRQHHAAKYFRCAVVVAPNATSKEVDNHKDTVVGYVCATKCHGKLTHDSMSVHEAHGRTLAIHSVVVAERYRRRGVATRMLQDYVASVVAEDPATRPHTIVLLAKANLLGFYVQAGFRVIRPSAVVHGDELWYDLECTVADAEAAHRPRCYTVDAFGQSMSGTGNPAAVVPLTHEPTDPAWMQTVAQEFNLSETAFCWPRQKSSSDDGDNNNTSTSNELSFGIRYFTPTTEVALCGHATLACAAIVVQTHDAFANDTAGTTLAFFARDDVLRARPTERRGHSTKVAMEFPTKPVTPLNEADVATVQGMINTALGIPSSGVKFAGLSHGLGDLLVEVTHDAFHSMGYGKDLTINALLSWDGYSRGVIVCCLEDTLAVAENDSERTEPTVHFSSRFFGPKAGIGEDPVTGSAHCALAPYFGSQLQLLAVVGRQASERGGIVECELSEDGETVSLTGSAVTTVTGTLWI